jgi:hypothetical protein
MRTLFGSLQCALSLTGLEGLVDFAYCLRPMLALCNQPEAVEASSPAFSYGVNSDNSFVTTVDGFTENHGVISIFTSDACRFDGWFWSYFYDRVRFRLAQDIGDCRSLAVFHPVAACPRFLAKWLFPFYQRASPFTPVYAFDGRQAAVLAFVVDRLVVPDDEEEPVSTTRVLSFGWAGARASYDMPLSDTFGAFVRFEASKVNQFGTLALAVAGAEFQKEIFPLLMAISGPYRAGKRFLGVENGEGANGAAPPHIPDETVSTEPGFSVVYKDLALLDKDPDLGSCGKCRAGHGPLDPRGTVPDNSRANQVRAVDERVLKVANPVVPPPIYDQYQAEFRSLVCDPSCLTPITVDEVAAAKRKPDQKVSRDFSELFWDAVYTIRSFVFLKKEGGKLGDPRIITPTSDCDQTTYSRFTIAIGALFKLKHWYAFGYSPGGQVRRVCQLAALHAEFLAVDFSRFDGTISAWLDAAWLDFMTHSFGVSYSTYLVALYLAGIAVVCTIAQGISYVSMFAQLSGRDDTSVANSYRSGLVQYCYLRTLGHGPVEAYRLLGLSGGDDTIVPCFGPTSVDVFKQVCRDLGLSVKVQVVSTDEPFDFLGRCYPAARRDTSTFYPLQRFAVKAHVICTSKEFSIAESLVFKAAALHLTERSTLVGDWCRAVFRTYPVQAAPALRAISRGDVVALRKIFSNIGEDWYAEWLLGSDDPYPPCTIGMDEMHAVSVGYSGYDPTRVEALQYWLQHNALTPLSRPPTLNEDHYAPFKVAYFRDGQIVGEIGDAPELTREGRKKRMQARGLVRQLHKRLAATQAGPYEAYLTPGDMCAVDVATVLRARGEPMPPRPASYGFQPSDGHTETEDSAAGGGPGPGGADTDSAVSDSVTVDIGAGTGLELPEASAPTAPPNLGRFAQADDVEPVELGYVPSGSALPPMTVSEVASAILAAGYAPEVPLQLPQSKKTYDSRHPPRGKRGGSKRGKHVPIIDSQV